MEPKLPAPNRGPEHFPSALPQTPEYGPSPLTHEQGVERRQEQVERRGEMPGAEAPQLVLPPPVVIPTQPVPAADDTTPQATSDDAPLVANDDDLIEKEWVDKAKKIISETKDDPYRREKEVSRLQADYLQKRYGKELGAAD
jgi:hypothetical protein